MAMTPSPHIADFHWSSAAAAHTEDYLLTSLSQLLPHTHIHQALDLGCGNGWLTHWLSSRGYRVIGVDPSPSGIQQAQHAYPSLSFYCQPATPDLLAHLNLDPVDLVISTEVVEHCYAPRDWAAACYNSLRPGGQLICSTPYHGYLKNLALAITGQLDRHFTALWDGGHIKFWSRHTLSQLLLEVGFTQLDFLGAGRLPYLWKSMLFRAHKPKSGSPH